MRLDLAQARELTSNAKFALALAASAKPRLLVAQVVVGLTVGLLPAGLAVAMRGLVNVVVDVAGRSDASLGPAVPWLAMGLLFASCEAVGRLYQRFLTGRMADALELYVNTRILVHAARLDVAFFEDPASQDLIHRARQDTARRFTRFLTDAIACLTGTVQILSLAGILLLIEPIALVVLPPFAFLHMRVQWRATRRYYDAAQARTQNRRNARYFVSLLTDREFVPEVKLLRLEQHLIGRYRELTSDFLDQNQERYRRRFRGGAAFTLSTTVIVYGLFLRVIHRVIQGGLTVGDVAIFGTAALRLRNALTSTVAAGNGFMEQTLFIANLREFLATRPQIDSPPSTSSRLAGAVKGEVEMRNVDFTYPGAARPSLRGVSLHVDPGETIALVGSNGAGKTTLVKLLARFYDPDEGSVLLDGVDLRDVDLDLLHRSTTFVFQKFLRYEATAAENIAFGDWRRLGGDRAEIERLAKAAGVEPLIRALPEGFDTMLGRHFGGHDLSGGQWQQIAIARALARQAPLVILDEPTSSLDAESEYEIFRRFRDLARGRTTVLVSHRFGTVSMADRIYVLEGGRIVEHGSHRELLRADGRYARLFALQRRQMGIEDG